MLKKKFTGGAWTSGIFKKDLEKKPLISIVMPNLRNENLKKAIDSILRQKYSNFELIIIDGGSGQKTINLLHSYKNKIDYWISQKDNGIWDSWNKGFKQARGKFVGIVDSSNILYPNALNILKNYILKNPTVDFICGAVKKDGRVYAGLRADDVKKQFNIIPSSTVGFFVKLDSLKKVGYLNLNYKIQADYDLLYRMIVIKKLKGIFTKSTELFGSTGTSGFSIKNSWIKNLVSEMKIRNANKQNKIYLIYIFFGRILMRLLKLAKKNIFWCRQNNLPNTS